MNKKTAGSSNDRRWSDRTFWLLGAAMAAVMLVSSGRDLSRPFQGLHSWGKADGARFARAHAVYGLGYTKGIMSEAVGYPPPPEQRRYVNHPQMSPLVAAIPMWLFGPSEGVYRGYWVVMNVVAALVLLLLLRRLLPDAAALAAGLLWAIQPITSYFGTGGPLMILGLLTIYFYLRLIGEIGPPAVRRRWLWVGLIASIFFVFQFAWTGGFFCLAVFIHYIGRCLFRRTWPRAGMLAVLIVAPALSAAVTFAVMLNAFHWDYQRVIDLFTWRAGTSEMTGQMASLTWSYWLGLFWQHAMTNFGLPAMLLAMVGLAAHVVRRVTAWQASRETKSPTTLIVGSPQLLLFLMPGVLQLLILRGTLIKHQYWELPLSPFLAIAGALCLLAVWDLLRRVGKVFAGAVLAIVLSVVGYSCVQGANYYYDIRWQHDDRIALWKELNRLIPPDKALLTFDPVMDGLLVTQSQAKGEVIRAEPAWYIDRPIERVPGKEQATATYQALAAASARLVNTINGLRWDYQQGLVSGEAATARQERAIGRLDIEVKQQLKRDLPAILDALRARRNEAPIYLLPGGLDHPQILPLATQVYLDGLREELGRHFAMVYQAPAREGKVTRAQSLGELILSTHSLAEEGKYSRDDVFFQIGMRSYWVFDLRRSPAEKSPRQPTTQPPTTQP